ncbi:MAG: tetratricopeptide repeat protein [Desulfatibacillaceae bacterium]|nr:tetratricopeptide repeat protein [Desulfatibacillaceae bacterium]
MSQKKETPFSKRQVDRNFLLVECSPKPKPGPEDSRQAAHAMSARFPEAPIGKAFVDQAKIRLKNVPVFAVMGIRPDLAPEQASGSEMALALVETAAAADTLIQKSKGFWGLAGETHLAAAFPGLTPKKAQKLAIKLQKATTTENFTVSVGIAVFPTLDYSPAQVVENAAKALMHALLLGPGRIVPFDSVSLNVSGDSYYQEGNLELALAEYQKALQLDKDNENVHNSLGVCLGRTNKMEQALLHFQKALALAPSNVMPAYNIGLVRMLQDDMDSALTWFDKALAVEPELYEALVQAGKAHSRLNRLEKARELLEKAASIRPKSIAAHKILADMLADAFLYKEAAKAYSRVLRIKPSDADSLSRLAWVYTQMGENAQIAKSFARQSVKLDPNNGLYAFRMGEILEHWGEPEAALAHFERALALGYQCRDIITELNGRISGSNTKATQ